MRTTDATLPDEEIPAPSQVRRGRAERASRATLPACGTVWTAAEIMHVTGVPWADVAWGTAALAAIAYARTARRAKGDDAWRHARHVATGITLTGTWTAWAAAAGPLAGPYGALTWTWAGASLGAAWWVHRHEIVASAREWRHRRSDWHSTARRWRLAGSFLLHHEYTRLGEMMIADVTGTRRLASDIARSNVAEWIAQDRGVPRGRVTVEEAPGPAGRVMITVREKDPWAHPITHPFFAADPEIDLSGPCTCREPWIIGQDPETGDPLTIRVWDQDGGKRVLVVATTRAGKTVLLNCLRERATAARDVLVVDLNLSKALEDKEWAPACHLTAVTRAQQARAVKILRLLCSVIDWRSQQPRETAVFQPSPGDPLILLFGDEIDALTRVQGALQLLEYIDSKGGSEGVSVVRAGQRGTADWMGATSRVLADVFCIGMVSRRGEAMHAAGDLGLEMPDMSRYGEGRKGVWAIAELGGGIATGRTFLLKEPGEIRAIVEERADSRPVLPEILAAFLGEKYEHLLGTDAYARWAAGREPVTPVGPSPRPAAPASDSAMEGQRGPVAVIDHEGVLATLDHEAERYMDEVDDGSDLRQRLAGMRRQNYETHRFVNETGAMEMPDIPPDQMKEIAAARWRMIGEATEITAAQRDSLAVLLGRGTTIAEVMSVLAVSRWEARGILDLMRGEGLAVIDGKGRGARWRSAAPGEGDGT